MSISGIISHFLWENQFRTLNKRSALVLCSVQGLNFDLTLPLFSCTIPLKAYRVCPLARSVCSAILPLEKVKVQLPFFQLPQQVKQLLLWFCSSCVSIYSIACTQKEAKSRFGFAFLYYAMYVYSLQQIQRLYVKMLKNKGQRSPLRNVAFCLCEIYLKLH